ALRRELGLRGALRLESDPRKADYVLRGRVLPLGLRSNSFSSFVVALEYQVTLTLELEVLRKEGDVLRLPQRALSESDVYLGSQDIEVTRTNRLEALRHLSDVLATRVVDRVEWLTEPKAAAQPAGEGGGG
ncbi:MAG: LPS assembly lipoprotein LptE, partial [Myxococcota bacterium]